MKTILTSNADARSLDGQIAELMASQPATNASNLLVDIAFDLNASEKTGPEVSEALAKIVDSLLKEKLPEDKVQSKDLLIPVTEQRDWSTDATCKPFDMASNFRCVAHAGLKNIKNSERSCGWHDSTGQSYRFSFEIGASE